MRQHEHSLGFRCYFVCIFKYPFIIIWKKKEKKRLLFFLIEGGGGGRISVDLLKRL